MNDDTKSIEEQIENPEIRKLLVSLKRMPEYLREKERRYHADKAFRRKVFEKACRQAGLIK